MTIVILLTAFLVLLMLRVPVAFALMLASLLYVLVLSPMPPLIIVHRMLGSWQTSPLLALPLFILAADIMNSGRITDKMFKFARSLIGHTRGALGHINVFASLIFSGMSGSITADIAGLGKILIPMMERNGYDKSFTVGITGASAVVGPIMPPSILMILYAMIAEQSVGRMFIGGIIPAFVIAGLLFTYIAVIARVRSYPVDSRTPLSGILRSFVMALPALMMPVIILGGIMSGIFTPTEAAAVAVVYALLISAFFYRSLDLRKLPQMLVGSSIATAMILLIMGSASVFGWILARENLPVLLQTGIESLTDQRWVVLLLLHAMFLIAGCFFDVTALVLVFTPMVLPILTAYNIDPVHWGVLQTLNVCIGFLTPPVGIGLYILADIAKMPVGQVTKAILPFYLPLLFALLVVTFVPQLVIWLPNLVLG